MTTKDAGLSYLRAGLSVIPVRARDKRPLIPWREHQGRRGTEAEVVTWWKRWPEAGVAVVCGQVSGVAVVDFDPRNGDGLHALADRLPRTPSAETGGGGVHYYFALPPGGRVLKTPGLLPGVDLQAEGSYVIAPPSVHPSGCHYRWRPGLALGEVPLAPLPPVIRQLVALRRAPEAEPASRRTRLAAAGLTLDAVLATLQGVRRCGCGWVARCPAHDDHDPSLSVAQGDGGRVLLHCFRGCAFDAILDALRRRAA